MPDFTKVDPGDALNIPAATWNTMVDSAKDYLSRRGGESASGPLLSSIAPATTVLVRNDTGSTLAYPSVLALGATVLDATAIPQDVQSKPGFAGTAPAAATDAFAVMIEPTEAGAYGRGVVAGVAVCDINVTDAAHMFAEPAAGVTATLASATSGPARIVSKESGTGTKRAVVLLGQASFGGECCGNGTDYFSNPGRTSNAGGPAIVYLDQDPVLGSTEDNGLVTFTGAYPASAFTLTVPATDKNILVVGNIAAAVQLTKLKLFRGTDTGGPSPEPDWPRHSLYRQPGYAQIYLYAYLYEIGNGGTTWVPSAPLCRGQIALDNSNYFRNADSEGAPLTLVATGDLCPNPVLGFNSGQTFDGNTVLIKDYWTTGILGNIAQQSVGGGVASWYPAWSGERSCMSAVVPPLGSPAIRRFAMAVGYTITARVGYTGAIGFAIAVPMNGAANMRYETLCCLDAATLPTLDRSPPVGMDMPTQNVANDRRRDQKPPDRRSRINRSRGAGAGSPLTDLGAP